MLCKEEIIDYLHAHQEYFDKKYGIRFIGLFGSFAKNSAHDNSDIDILYTIKKGKRLSIFKYLQLCKELEDRFHKKIDLVRFEALKPGLREIIQKDLHYV